MNYRQITEKYCSDCRIYLTELSLTELVDCGECFEHLTNNMENLSIIEKYKDRRGQDGYKTQGSRSHRR